MAKGSKAQYRGPDVLEATSPVRRYLEESRDLLTSIVLVLPLFVFYQVGVLAAGGIRNGVDFVSARMWMLVGEDLSVYLGINAGILLVLLGVIAYLRRGGSLRPQIFPFVLAESALYAVFFGGAVLQFMTWLGFGGLLASGAGGELDFIQKLVLSVGAGFYEELVFRLIGMGGIYMVLTRFARDVPTWVSAMLAVVLSSFVFSAIHHVGALGDPFTLGVFMFRFFAGVLLAFIFYVRGFAVAVYTHAIYDIIVMSTQGG
ncbi:MAG: CPBP family intramembrane glutamic endopeptidase [Myxococcota bacterium]